MLIAILVCVVLIVLFTLGLNGGINNVNMNMREINKSIHDIVSEMEIERRRKNGGK